MLVSNFPSLPTFLGKNKKTDYFQMLPSLPTFLTDDKLWLGRFPSLPILKARVHQYCQQSSANITFFRQMPRKPRQNMPTFIGNHTLPRPCQQCEETGQELFVRVKT